MWAVRNWRSIKDARAPNLGKCCLVLDSNILTKKRKGTRKRKHKQNGENLENGEK